MALSSGTTTWSFTVGDAPGAPVVTAVPSGAGQVTVSWQADGHGLPITRYRIDDVTTGQSQVVIGSQTSAVFAGLAIGATHEFRVVATNDLGDGPAGTAAATAVDAPPAPVLATVVPGSASAYVSWTFTQNDTAPATGFQIELDDGAPLDVGYVTARTLAALDAGHTYAVRVRATNMAVAGPWSPPRSVTPSAPGRLFHGLPLPVRALDTRTGAGAVAAGTVAVVAVVGTTGVVASVVAAVSHEPHRHQRHRARLLHGVAVRPAPADGVEPQLHGRRARRAQPRHRAGRPRRHRLHHHRCARGRRDRRRRRVVLLRRRPQPGVATAGPRHAHHRRAHDGRGRRRRPARCRVPPSSTSPPPVARTRRAT